MTNMNPANATRYDIKEVQLAPVQNVLIVAKDRSATIEYTIGKLTPGTPGVVGSGQILESGIKGTPNYQPYIPALNGSPTVADQILPVMSDTIVMTDDEWNAWSAQGDDDYRAAVVIKRLGLTLS